MWLVSRTDRRWIGLAGALALVVGAGIVAWVVPHAPGPVGGEIQLEAIDDHGLVPEFALTERSGRMVSRGELLGRVWVANFMYTKCTETCPTQSLQIARLQAEFAGAPDLRFVSITVDPKHDTPGVLQEYAERYEADPERWLFLTGDKRQIYCLARDGFRLSVLDPEDPSPPACGGAGVDHALGAVQALLSAPPAFATHGSQGLVMHSARVVLVDRGGHVRAYHLATDSDSMKRLPANVRTLLAERRRET
jgi:protein SCO1/2